MCNVCVDICSLSVELGMGMSILMSIYLTLSLQRSRSEYPRGLARVFVAATSGKNVCLDMVISGSSESRLAP